MRLFVAVDPSVEARTAIERAMTRVKAKASGAKWVDAEGMHITLVFLGEIEDALEPAIEEAIGEVAKRHAPFSLSLTGGGSFGPPARPRVLWVGVQGDLEPIRALAADLGQVLVPFGVKLEDRPFVPHLTLARAREGRGDPGLAACVEGLSEDFGELRVGPLVLYRSDLGPKGARYTALCSPELCGGPGLR